MTAVKRLQSFGRYPACLASESMGSEKPQNSPHRDSMKPKGILIDYGCTLVEEIGFDARAGNEALLRLAAYRPADVTIDRLLQHARTVSDLVAQRRDQFGIETPWPALTRLIHDFLGVRFDIAVPELELAFWKASVT